MVNFYFHPSTDITNIGMFAVITAFGEADMTAAMRPLFLQN